MPLTKPTTMWRHQHWTSPLKLEEPKKIIPLQNTLATSISTVVGVIIINIFWAAPLGKIPAGARGWHCEEVKDGWTDGEFLVITHYKVECN